PEVRVLELVERLEQHAPALLPLLPELGRRDRARLELGLALPPRLLAVLGEEVREARLQVARDVPDEGDDGVAFRPRDVRELPSVQLIERGLAQPLVATVLALDRLQDLPQCSTLPSEISSRTIATKAPSRPPPGRSPGSRLRGRGRHRSPGSTPRPPRAMNAARSAARSAPSRGAAGPPRRGRWRAPPPGSGPPGPRPRPRPAGAPRKGGCGRRSSAGSATAIRSGGAAPPMWRARPRIVSGRGPRPAASRTAPPRTPRFR